MVKLFATLSASLYIDFGDGLGISPSLAQAISELLDFLFSSDPNGAKVIELVYRYSRKAWKLLQAKRGGGLVWGKRTL